MADARGRVGVAVSLAALGVGIAIFHDRVGPLALGGSIATAYVGARLMMGMLVGFGTNDAMGRPVSQSVKHRKFGVACDRRFDPVTFVATHNSMNHMADGFMFPEQELSARGRTEPRRGELGVDLRC